MKMDNMTESNEQLRNDKEKLERRLERVNEKLLKSEKLKSDFLSNIKNEINNPLTSILGLLNQSISNPEDTERNIKNAKLIYDEVYSLNFQMRNIFNAAEIEAGQSFPELSNVNIKELIEETITSFKHLLTKNEIEIKLEYSGEEHFVSDREKLEVVMANLISNAIKFSDSSSQIMLGVINSESNLEIKLQDFGVGINEDDLNLIYDRFKQLDTGTRKGFGGHGLGLAVVNSLIEILEGKMVIDSRSGEGTQVAINLPLRSLDNTSIEEDEILFSNSEEEGEIF